MFTLFYIYIYLNIKCLSTTILSSPLLCLAIPLFLHILILPYKSVRVWFMIFYCEFMSSVGCTRLRIPTREEMCYNSDVFGCGNLRNRKPTRREWTGAGVKVGIHGRDLAVETGCGWLWGCPAASWVQGFHLNPQGWSVKHTVEAQASGLARVAVHWVFSSRSRVQHLWADLKTVAAPLPTAVSSGGSTE